MMISYLAEIDFSTHSLSCDEAVVKQEIDRERERERESEDGFKIKKKTSFPNISLSLSILPSLFSQMRPLSGAVRV
jgi:hypothetical protein